MGDAASKEGGETGTGTETGFQERCPADITLRLLSLDKHSALIPNPWALCSDMQDINSLFDTDLLECLWGDLLLVCMSINMRNYKIVCSRLGSEEDSKSDEKSYGNLQKERIGRLYQLSNEFLTELLRIVQKSQIDHVLVRRVEDTTIYLYTHYTTLYTL